MPKNKLTVQAATEAHAAQLAEHIRPEDAAEMMAAYGLEPLAGLRLALEKSATATAVLDGERVVAMFGVAPSDGAGAASIWMIAAKLAKKFPLALTRICGAAARELADRFGVLLNMVWAENRNSLRWLESLGFEVHAPISFGVSGLPFHPIVLRRS